MGIDQGPGLSQFAKHVVCVPDGQSRERDRTENVQTAPKLAASASTVQNTTQHACPALSSPSLDLRAFVLFLDLSLAAAWRTIRSLSCSFVLSLSNALSISACATPSATARFDNSLGFSALSSAFIVGVGAMRRTMSCSRTRLSSWDPRRQRLACRCRSQGCGGCQLAYCPGRRRHNACICMPGPAAGRSGQAAGTTVTTRGCRWISAAISFVLDSFWIFFRLVRVHYV